MGPEQYVGVAGITALSIAGLMAAGFSSPDKSPGLKRAWLLCALLCAEPALNLIPGKNGWVWVEPVGALIAAVAGFLYPWILWKLFTESRHSLSAG